MLDKKLAKQFPPVGKEFTLKYGDVQDKVCIEVRDCECMGPERPHQHPFLPLGAIATALPWGAMRRIVIVKVSANTYEVRPEVKGGQK